MRELAIITLPIVDLRSAPSRRQSPAKDPEQESQVLYGEYVKVLDEKGDYLYIEALDQPYFDGQWRGYPGWILKGSIGPVPEGPSYIVSKPWITYLGLCLSFGSRVWERQPEPAPITELASYFLGSPYAWGGLSSHDPNLPFSGVDCSGLTHLVYRCHGIALPRNSKDQKRILERGLEAPGALVFLGDPVDHVMLLESPGQLIESTAQSMSVRRIHLKERVTNPSFWQVPKSYKSPIFNYL